MNTLIVNNVSYKYSQNDKFAVDDVSFEIEKGSYTAIVGLNGSGKSTLARILSGLEKPSKGSVTIEGNPIIGIVFQSPKDQLVSGLVYRDTEFGPLNLHLTPDEVELRTIESLNIVDMLDRAESPSSALSLGQTQKIALSGIIALRPDILILDEAVAMLDPVSRKDIYEFLRYWHKCGNTIIHITHDEDGIEEASQILAMENGKLCFHGKREEFFQTDFFKEKIKGTPLPVANKESFTSSANKEISFSAKKLSFEYSKKAFVKNISFDLFKGSVTALTGPSGAGKSTILELCTGLLEPSNGTVYEYSNSNQRAVLAQQNAQAALFEQFAADDVAFGPKNKGIQKGELLDIVKKSMDTAGILFEEFAERRTFALSGGEQRRLSIAGILAMDSNVLFFDEPTAGLDSISRYKVMMMFRELAKQGKTIVFTTHKRDEADFADREIVVEKGVIVSDSCEDAKAGYGAKIEQKVYSGAGMLKSLRQTSSKLSGENKHSVTIVQKLPAWFRILLFLLLFVLSLAGKSILFCITMLFVTAVYGMFSGFTVPKLIKACLKILPFLMIFAVLQLIFHPAIESETVYLNLSWITVTPSKLLFCLATLLRTDAAIACLCAFFISTPEYDLIDGLKILLKPLELIKLPTRYFILIMEIVFRFLPLLVDEAIAIIKTQLIRGGLGKTKGAFARILAVIPLIVPMIIQTIKKSEALADAITVRCFS